MAADAHFAVQQGTQNGIEQNQAAGNRSTTNDGSPNLVLEARDSRRPSESADVRNTNRNSRETKSIDGNADTRAGELNTAANRDVVRDFVGAFPKNQQASFMAADGMLSQQGVARLRNAMLHKAYGDTPTLSRMVESTDQGSRNVVNALTQASSKVASAKEGIASGDLHNADIADDVVAAVEVLAKIKSDGGSLRDYLAQHGLFGEDLTVVQRKVLQFLNNNIRSAKKINAFIQGYYDALEAQGSPKQQGMFGDEVAPTKEQLLDKVIHEQSNQHDGTSDTSGGLFDDTTNSTDSHSQDAARHERSVGATAHDGRAEPQSTASSTGRGDTGQGLADKLNQELQKAQAEKPKLDEYLTALAKATGAQAKLAPVKGSARALEKIIHDYDGKVDKIKDLLRGSIVAENQEQALKVFELLRQSAPVADGKGMVKNTLDADTADGYRDAKVIVKVGDVKAEILIISAQMQAAKKQAHKLYEQSRVLNAEVRSADERGENTSSMRAEVERLDEKMKRVYDAAFNASMRANSTSSNQSAMASDLVQGTPSRMAVSRLNSLLLGSNANQSQPSPFSSTNGTPSKSRNLADAGMLSNGDFIVNSSSEKSIVSESRSTHARDALTSQKNYTNAAEVKADIERVMGAGSTGRLSAVNIENTWTDALLEKVKRGQLSLIAWHGTPHSIDKFSTDKIGTGEGAQVYGYGLYFADNKAVAEVYKNRVVDMVSIGKINDELDRLSKIIDSDSISYGKYKSDIGRDANKKYHELMKERHTTRTKKGNLYQVELAPKENEYLLWDKPLSSQSKKVKDAIKQSKFYNDAQDWFELSGEWYHDVSKKTGESIYKHIQSGVGNSNGLTAKEASEYLQSLGIRGIKYLDGSSRSSGEGSYNYVVFDDNDVAIKAQFSKNDTSNAQGFFDPKNNQITLIADRIAKGEAMAVLLHEIGHKQLQSTLGTIGVKRLTDAVTAWKGAPVGSNERKVFDAAHGRATASGDYNGEFLAYAIEEAEKLGLSPDVKAPVGTVEKWLALVKDMFSKAVTKLMRGKTADLDVSDLTAIARGAAALELKGSATKTIVSQNSNGDVIADTQEGVDNFWKWYNSSHENSKTTQSNDARRENQGYSQRHADIQADTGRRRSVDAQNSPTGTSQVSSIRRAPVDADGRPIVFYHGTRDGFTEFDLEHPNRKDVGWLGRGVYGTNDKDLAESYSRLKRGSGLPQVMPLYFAVSKPYLVFH